MARADLRAATILAAHSTTPSWIPAFHIQQAGEKAIKAFLVSKKLEIPKSHDLVWLCERHADLAAWALRLAPLSDGAVVQRYPGDEGADIDIAEALDLVEELLQWVESAPRASD